MIKRSMLILCMIILFLMGTAFNALAATLCMPNNQSPSASIEIPIEIDGGGGIAGFQFTVTYDSSVLNCTSAVAGDLTSGWTIIFNPVTGDILGVNPSLTPLAAGISGSLVKLQCDYAGGLTDICLSAIKLKSEVAEEIPSAVCGDSCAIIGAEGQNFLTVTSSDPSSGVIVTASPADNDGYDWGWTPFTQTYSDNVYVSLTAPLTAAGNNFGSWGGCDSSSGNTCYVMMNGNKSVTAIYFSPLINYSVVRFQGGTPVAIYEDIWAGFNDPALTNGDIIKMHAVTFDEDPNFNRPNISVLLKGGYDQGFSSQLGMTTVQGTMTIRAGTLTVENLLIR